MMKKILTLLLTLSFTLSVVTNVCQHVHDEACGYDETTETGCTHECNDSCFGVDPHYGYGPDGDHD